MTGMVEKPARADIVLPPVLGSNMAVQSGEELEFWGWANAGEKVTIKQGGTVVATAEGRAGGVPWNVKLPAQPAGPVGDIEVSGANTITLQNIVAGEVWLCSGQSNMVMTLQKGAWCGYGGVTDADKEVAAATDSQIRLFTGRNWVVCSPETAPEFSGTAYFFAKRLRSELKVPVGLLVSASGGTAAELWTPSQTLEGDPEFAKLKAKASAIKEEFGARYLEDQKAAAAWKKQVEDAKQKGQKIPTAPVPQLTPEQTFLVSDSAPILSEGGLYKAKIRPLAPFNIKGAVWYQGESNARRGEVYHLLMTNLIRGWREDWKKPFPFVMVGLAGFGKPEAWTPNQGSYPLLREAQIETAKMLPNVGVVSALDVGHATNIHPPDKQSVGERAALWALKNVYGRREIVAGGPKFGAVTFGKGKAEVIFEEDASGLVLKSAQGFELAGADRKFVPAKAELKGGRIEVSAPGVEEPEALRYAFLNFPECTVYNGAGLPALPFRTDKWTVAPVAK